MSQNLPLSTPSQGISSNREKVKITGKETKVGAPSIVARRGSLSQLPTARDEKATMEKFSSPPVYPTGRRSSISMSLPTTPTTTITTRRSSYHSSTSSSAVTVDQTRSRNIHTEFVGLKEFRRLNANQIKLFEQWCKERAWKKFHNSHYDWWIFPICDKSNFGFKYSIFDEVRWTAVPKFCIDNLPKTC
jgi:hypothetical protein